jgi:hypothetical protein
MYKLRRWSTRHARFFETFYKVFEAGLVRMQERGKGFFLPTDKSIVPSLGVVSTWATSQHYEQAAVSTFLQVADYYLVAHAHAGGHTVVSHEVASASTRKIKIPDACIGLRIKFMTPYQMLRKERARFVLGGRP